MSNELTPAFPFSSIEDERLYRCHKLFAESYTTNLRNLEAPWKPVIASVLEAIIKKVCKKQSSIAIAVQQEQPLAPPALSAASADADRTMTSLKHKGTVYPDVSVLRYLVDAGSNFRALSRNNMGHKTVDYLVCGELKRSVNRADIQKGLRKEGETRNSYRVLLAFLRSAAMQASRQAFVAMKRPEVVNSDIILIATSGPFWMWCLAQRDIILGTFSTKTMDRILLDVEYEHIEDNNAEDINAVDLDDLEGDDGSYIPIPTVPFSTISPEKVFTSVSPKEVFHLGPSLV